MAAMAGRRVAGGQEELQGADLTSLLLAKIPEKEKEKKNCPEMPRLSNSTVVDRESSLKGIEYKENDTRRLTERQAVELGEQTDRQKKQGGQ